MRFDNMIPGSREWGFNISTLRKTNRKEKRMAGKFKLVVKDGETKYKYDPETGRSKSKTVDRVEKFEDFAVALSEFLYLVTDNYDDSKVSLTFVPKKNKK